VLSLLPLVNALRLMQFRFKIALGRCRRGLAYLVFAAMKIDVSTRKVHREAVLSRFISSRTQILVPCDIAYGAAQEQWIRRCHNPRHFDDS
jgi:hypothetical protein